MLQAAGGAGLTGGVAESPDVGERTQAVTRNPFLDDSEESDTEEVTRDRREPSPLHHTPKRMRASTSDSPKLDKTKLKQTSFNYRFFSSKLHLLKHILK